MPFINIKHPQQRVTFQQAVELGIGHDQGLFMPEKLAPLEHIPQLLEMDFASRSSLILGHIIGSDMPGGDLDAIVTAAFDFPLPVRKVSANIHALELFHGTSLAFKDFGARFMARCLSTFRRKDENTRPMTILTATSGDTGAAVAEAFYKRPGN